MIDLRIVHWLFQMQLIGAEVHLCFRGVYFHSSDVADTLLYEFYTDKTLIMAASHSVSVLQPGVIQQWMRQRGNSVKWLTMLFLIMLFLIHGCPIPYLAFRMQILYPYQVRMGNLRSQEEDDEGDKTFMVGWEREEEDEKSKPVAFLRVVRASSPTGSVPYVRDSRV